MFIKNAKSQIEDLYFRLSKELVFKGQVQLTPASRPRALIFVLAPGATDITEILSNDVVVWDLNSY